MFTHLVFWLWFAGLIYLAGGVFSVRRELAAARGLDRWIILGPAFVAAALAVFAAEHFVDAREIMQLVPAWMPARLFWTYFVGCGLLAAATSFVTKKFVRLSATLLGIMFLLFVLMMDLPGAVATPGDRLAWSFVFRESAFAGGALALAASEMRNSPAGRRNSSAAKWLSSIGRTCVALAVIYFGLEQLLHPEFAPGVPDVRLTPPWLPLHALWGYPVGAFLLLAGAALLIHQRPRIAAVSIALVMTLITLVIHLPILALALTRDPSQMTEGINYVFDTLLFAGTALLVALACPERSRRGSRADHPQQPMTPRS
jgi:uncharacterized membrane protein YphA (DoxX/SURF4 family)